jgi:hypothetical protein
VLAANAAQADGAGGRPVPGVSGPQLNLKLQ